MKNLDTTLRLIVLIIVALAALDDLSLSHSAPLMTGFGRAFVGVTVLAYLCFRTFRTKASSAYEKIIKDGLTKAKTKTNFKPKTHLLKVQNKIRETSDAVSIVFQIPSELSEAYKYKPGQFITLFVTLKGEELRRSYSLSSSPNIDQEFRITTKKVPGGKVSSFIVDELEIGDTVEIGLPIGNFFKHASFKPSTHLILLSAGSGITPIISIAKYALSTGQRLTLIYANRNQNSIIFNHEISLLEAKYSGQFTALHVLSEPEADWKGLAGFLTRTMVDNVISSVRKSDPTSTATEFYMCGPTPFMDHACQLLKEIGIDKQCVHRESFAGPLGGLVNKDGAASEGVVTGTLTATFNGKSVVVTSHNEETVLISLLSAGHRPPFGCLVGSCRGCLCKVKSGKVAQAQLGELTPAEAKEDKVLACMAVAESADVEIEFETED